MVRLKVTYAYVPATITSSFNSKMVRLKDDRIAFLVKFKFCFNSKMVRLKEAGGVLAYNSLFMFQFQNGAIKSYTLVRPGELRLRFNSKMVRLKGSESEVHIILKSVSIPKWCD